MKLVALAAQNPADRHDPRHAPRPFLHLRRRRLYSRQGAGEIDARVGRFVWSSIES
jgi:hypothetical protein